MADCSAAGTTIDRAARAVLGAAGVGGSASTTASASKHVSAFLGHVAISGNGAVVAMPMTSPDHLILPTPNMAMTSRQTPSHSGTAAITSMPQHRHPSPMDQVWNSQMNHHQQQNPSAMMMAPQIPSQRQYHMMMTMMDPMHVQMQQQRQMQFQVQLQHHQQHMAFMMQQRQREDRKIQPVATRMIREAEPHYQTPQQQQLGHDGIVRGASMEQLAAAWAKAEAEYEQEQQGDDNVTVGEYATHDGLVQGASIEDLALAWEEAEREYDQVLSDMQSRSEFGSAVEEDYANLWQGDTMEDQDHATRPYQFVNTPAEVDSQKPATDSVDFMEKGMRYFQEGNLKQAIRSFEMELQQKDPDNATAWRMLGRCHAENDQDPEAIKCLEAAVDRDPYSPEALIALGVSYVNELNHERALENMKAWLTHNPKYAGMDLPSKSNHEEDIYGAASGASNTSDSAFQEVKTMLEAALEFDPTDAADVHEALGVIYNVIKDYDAAARSFRKALETKPYDYQLWNKLGATLANGSQSDEALPAYHRALQIKPKYARAWLNMAISHSNLQDHDEAARCYLQTLSLNPNATHCWTYLRMALSSKERWDLLPLVFSRDLAGFQKEFDFLLY